jgi:predicted SprT family Zn-dependent metalloprotease
MDIATNTFNLQKRIDYALANLAKNAPDLASQMRWCWTDVVVSKRLRRAAGRCVYWRKIDTMRIEFSESTFQGISEMNKTDTVIHELAHAVCFRLSLDRGHGAEFKRVCKLMGGSGNRVLSVEPGTVKKNLVKRWVLVRKSNTSKLFIRTRKEVGDFFGAFNDAFNLGVIQVDQNQKTVKWLSVCQEPIRTVNPLEGKFKLVA